MKELIQRLIFAWRFRRAVRKADRLHQLTRLKFFVIVIGGKLRVIAKQDCRRLIRQRRRVGDGTSGMRYFKKGTRIEDIERKALYITP